MKTLLIGNGYWGKIIKNKLKNITDLLYTADSKDNIEILLNNNNIDFVFVCTPTETHYDIVKKCILNKKNHIIEMRNNKRSYNRKRKSSRNRSQS